MYKKRRAVGPSFKTLTPYNAVDGKYAGMGERGVVTRVAMMQVIEEDTHEKYLVCRGFDPECGKFLHSVTVGKAWGSRTAGTHEVGEIVSAVKPMTALGDTPGVAETSDDQPADLDETVNILTDDSDNPIAWIVIGGGGSSLRAVELKTSLTPGGSATGWYLTWNTSTNEYDKPEYDSEAEGYVEPVTVYDGLGMFEGTGYDDLDGSGSGDGERGALGFIDQDNVLVQLGPSDEGSSSWSGSDSESGSESGSGSGDDSGGDSGSGSDKSTCIVPASWTPGGYTALYTAESPEVVFTDSFVATVKQVETRLPIDPRFMEVCQSGTVECSGCQPDVPVAVGAKVEDGDVLIRFADENPDREVRLVVGLTATRRGFKGMRFGNRTRNQFDHNERFINSAYPKDQQ